MKKLIIIISVFFLSESMEAQRMLGQVYSGFGSVYYQTGGRTASYYAPFGFLVAGGGMNDQVGFEIFTTLTNPSTLFLESNYEERFREVYSENFFGVVYRHIWSVDPAYDGGVVFRFALGALNSTRKIIDMDGVVVEQGKFKQSLAAKTGIGYSLAFFDKLQFQAELYVLANHRELKNPSRTGLSRSEFFVLNYGLSMGVSFCFGQD